MKTFGIIGGLGTIAGGDVFFKLLKSKTVLENQRRFHFLFEQHPYQQIDTWLQNEADVQSRKFYVYNVCKSLEAMKVDRVLLPCFASHTFIDQLQTELNIPIVNILEALREHITSVYPKGSKIGVLTSDYVKKEQLFDKYFPDYKLVFPDLQPQLMEAIYGKEGIKNGHLSGLAVEVVHQACEQLEQADCSVIVPGVTELPLINEQLWRRGVHILDCNQIYVDYAIATVIPNRPPEFKLGILGGVGPAATVDFMAKVIKNTPAQKDQDHIKMIVDQNPQIPDRTANLLRGEPDPTLAMFATCKRLEAEGAGAIAIPCNTAHAFVEKIQPYLSVPIVNMLYATVEYIIGRFGPEAIVGLLATSGTIGSRVYHEVAAQKNLKIIEPDARHQELVMESIYGEYGVKAGYTDGRCLDDIQKAMSHLIGRGANVLILGCTELPLMFPDRHSMLTEGKEIDLVDPTTVLAKKCVSIALNRPIDFAP